MATKPVYTFISNEIYIIVMFLILKNPETKLEQEGMI